jgi:D-3-phosphoglycerate dehydrogenase
MKVYIPQEVAHEGTDYLKAHGYEVKVGTGFSIEEMKRDIADCDAMLLRTAHCPGEVLEAGKQIKIVARHGVGYDNIDLKAAEKLGIWVTNTPQALSDSVAEFTLASILMAAKNIPACKDAMYRQDYGYKNSHKGLDVYGKSLGIVGFGRIGRAVAQKAYAGLEMNILAYDPSIKKEQVPDYVTLCSWEELFGNADFISLHMPGGEKNRNAVSAKEFSMMKDSAILLNMARGEVVDEKALDIALKAGELRCAVLDVQSQEPPAADSPLYQNEKVILTPHMASNTEECMGRMALHAAWQIHKVLSGVKPDWPVNNPQA